MCIRDRYSPDMRRDDALDICRQADILFGQFVSRLKARGVYDNSTIVFLSDHGMENMKDPKSGYQVVDLRDILRENGMVRHEDYEEVGGTELNNLWVKDPAKLAKVQKILEDYTSSRIFWTLASFAGSFTHRLLSSVPPTSS